MKALVVLTALFLGALLLTDLVGSVLQQVQMMKIGGLSDAVPRTGSDPPAARSTQKPSAQVVQ